MLEGQLIDELFAMVETAERNARTLTWGARTKPQSAPLSATYVYEFNPAEQMAGAA